jgi:hypothetical protein
MNACIGLSFAPRRPVRARDKAEMCGRHWFGEWRAHRQVCVRISAEDLPDHVLAWVGALLGFDSRERVHSARSAIVWRLAYRYLGSERPMCFFRRARKSGARCTLVVPIIKVRLRRFAVTRVKVRRPSQFLSMQTSLSGRCRVALDRGFGTSRRRSADLLRAGTEASREEWLRLGNGSESAGCEAVQKIGHAISK